MEYRKGNDIVDYLENIIYKDTQIQEDGIHLTVYKIFQLTGRGELDFGGSEYKECKPREIPPEKRSPDDKYGWWSLNKGEYLLEFNEKVVESLLEENILVLQPAEMLTKNGSYHPTFIINKPGRITTTLFVGEAGLNIKENARISKLIVIAK